MKGFSGSKLYSKMKFWAVIDTISLVYFPAISRDDSEESHQNNNNNHHHHHHHHRGGSGQNNKAQFNGYTSDEYLDRLEQNGNISNDKSDVRYGKRK